jgi:chemotaxis regulatin CheY-phosphate phosphatase CheZ
VEAKGEVGKLFNAINTTLHNLQQLDQSVHKESERVPELASHLDIITQETETATQQVLEKLDLMLEVSDRQTSAVEALQGSSRDRLQIDRDFNEHIQNFLLRLEHETDRDTVLQESLEFVALMGQESKRYLQKSETIHASIEEISSFSAQLQDHAFEIMNHLQFQDITRQKVGKVIGLLKEMQEGLMKLLSIFNIHGEVEAHTLELTDDHRATQDNILNRDATTDGREIIDVDAIIAGFKKNQ